jgi:hypothetical protein
LGGTALGMDDATVKPIGAALKAEADAARHEGEVRTALSN